MKTSDAKEVKIVKKLMRILGNVLFTLFMIVMIGLIFITAQSRFTGREPSLLGHRLYIVDSGSMSPTIKVNSMIVVKESEPQDIKEGDIITYYGSESPVKVTHRVMEVIDQGQTFITRGDANETDDPLPLEGEKVIGKVAFFIPLVGMMFRFLSSIHGIITLVILGAFWVIVPRIFANRGRHQRQSQQPADG